MAEPTTARRFRLPRIARERDLEFIKELATVRFPYMLRTDAALCGPKEIAIDYDAEHNVARLKKTPHTIQVTPAELPVLLTYNSPVRPPKHRSAAGTVGAGTVVVIKKIWGTVVFGLDVAADIWKHAGRVVALFITPVSWLLGNTAKGAARAWSWMFYRTKEVPEGLASFARPLSLLEAYSSTLLISEPLTLLPSWLLQPLGERMWRSHARRKLELAAEIFEANHNSDYANFYRLRMIEQTEEYAERIKAEQAKHAENNDTNSVVPPRVAKEDSADVVARKMHRRGWKQVSAKVSLDRSSFVVTMNNPAKYIEAFGHTNAAVICMDQANRFWAKPWEGMSLLKLDEEMRTGVPAIGTKQAPTALRRELRKVEMNARKWDKVEDIKEKSRLYGEWYAVTMVKENYQILTEDTELEKRRSALHDEVVPVTNKLKTEFVMRGFDAVVRKLTKILDEGDQAA